MNDKGPILGGAGTQWSRRQLLRVAGGASVVAASGVVGSQVLAAGKLREVKLAWNANAICLSAAPVAVERGILKSTASRSSSSTLRAPPTSCWRPSPRPRPMPAWA